MMDAIRRTGQTLPLLMALAAAPALAAEMRVGDIIVREPWLRATPAAAPVAAGYVTLVNAGPLPDRLTHVSSPAAARVEIHDMQIVDGIPRMRPVARAEIAPGQSLAMAPDGQHLMLVKPTSALRLGDRFPVTFTFEHAGTIDVLFEVRGMSGRSPAHHGHGATHR